MTITLTDNPATKLDLIVERAQRYGLTGAATRTKPFTNAEALMVLHALATFQEDENARHLFQGLHDSLRGGAHVF